MNGALPFCGEDQSLFGAEKQEGWLKKVKTYHSTPAALNGTRPSFLGSIIPPFRAAFLCLIVFSIIKYDNMS